MAGQTIDVLQYVIGVDNKDLQAGAQQAERSVENMAQSIQGTLRGLGLAFAGVFGLQQMRKLAESVGNFALQVTMTAARTEELDIVLRQVGQTAGYAYSYLKQQEEQIKSLGITTQASRTLLIRFMQSQLDVADAAKIARAAQDLAVIAMMDSSEAAETLTYAIAAQRPILLRQFGIVTDLSEVFGKQAKALGKHAEDLTEYEKRMAFFNVVMEQAARVSGTYEAAMTTAGKQARSLARYTEEAANAIGNILLPMFSQMVQDMTQGFKDIQGAAKGSDEQIKVWQDRMVALYQPVRWTFAGMKVVVDETILSVNALKTVLLTLPLALFSKLAGVPMQAKAATTAATTIASNVPLGPEKPTETTAAQKTFSDFVLKERAYLYQQLISMDEKYRFDYISLLRSTLADDSLTAAQRLSVRKALIEQLMTLRKTDIDFEKTTQADLADFIKSSNEDIASGVVDLQEQTNDQLNQVAENLKAAWLESSEVARQVYGAIGDTAGNALKTIVLSQESANKKIKAIMQDFLASILNVFARMLSEFIANALLQIAWHKFMETTKTEITRQEAAKRAALNADSGGSGGGLGFAAGFLGMVLPFFQTGGLVQGMGIAEDREYVLPQRVVEAVGTPALDRLRTSGKMSGDVTFNFSGMTFNNTTREDAGWIATELESRVREIVKEGILDRRLEI